MPSRPMRIHCGLNRSVAKEASDNSDEDGDKEVKRLTNPFKMTTRPYHVLSDISRECQERTQHNLIPKLNLGQHFINNNIELRNFPICKFLAPRPIYVSRASSELVDNSLKRPLAWDSWHRRLTRLKTNYEKAQNARGMRQLSKQNIYDRSFYELAEHINLNPDPYFDATYDYYYSGGNLALLPIVTTLMPTPLVAHCAAEEMFTFKISKFLESIPSGNQLFSVYKDEHESNSNEIFEVRTLKSYQVNRGNMFATRQKNKITLQQLFLGEPDSDSDSDSDGDNVMTSNDKESDDLEPGEIKVVHLNEFRSAKVPIMSFAQSASDASKFVVSNAKQTVRMYHIGRDSAVLERLVRLAADDNLYCNFMRAWQGQIIIFANSNYICPMDLRTKSDQWQQRCMHSESKDYILCDTITGISMSKNLNQFYVATTHKLHCLDVRYMDDCLEGKGSIATFTHQLTEAPMFIDTYAHDDVEFVALASAQPGDLCICEVSAANHLESTKSVPNASNYTAYTLPYQPPTLHEALQSARLSGKCLSLEANIKERIRKCTTGLTFYDMDNYRGKRSKEQQAAAYLMTANSIGDVFTQTVTKRGSQDEPDPRTDQHTDEVMVKYEQQVRKKDDAPLQCTSVHNLREMREIFGTKRYSLPKNYEPFDESSIKRCQGWRKRMTTLRRYQDYLTDYILDIWDVEDKNNYGARLNFEKHIGSADKNKFVNDWVERQLPLPEPVEQTSTINLVGVEKVEMETLASINEQAFADDEPHEAAEGQQLATKLQPEFTSTQETILSTIKEDFGEVSPIPWNHPFDSSTNAMVSLPMEVSQSYSQGNNEVFYFSQQRHSTAVKKTTTRKGF